MENRRRFMARGLGTLMGLAGGALTVRGLAQDHGDTPARTMITPATQEAIETGLAWLERNQRFDGSFGTGNHQGNVAITAICGLAFMAGGHQPGRGRYGRVVTRALEYIFARKIRRSLVCSPMPRRPSTAPCMATASPRSSWPRRMAWSISRPCASNCMANSNVP